MQLLSLLQNVNAIIASGTGPLHMAAALGCNSLGIISQKQRHWYAALAPDWLQCASTGNQPALPYC